MLPQASTSGSASGKPPPADTSGSKFGLQKEDTSLQAAIPSQEPSDVTGISRSENLSIQGTASNGVASEFTAERAYAVPLGYQLTGARCCQKSSNVVSLARKCFLDPSGYCVPSSCIFKVLLKLLCVWQGYLLLSQMTLYEFGTSIGQGAFIQRVSVSLAICRVFCYCFTPFSV